MGATPYPEAPAPVTPEQRWQQREDPENWQGRPVDPDDGTPVPPPDAVCRADAAWRQDRLLRSRQLAEQAWSDLRTGANAADQLWRARAQLTLGIVAHTEGRCREALSLLRAALQTFQQLGEEADAAQAGNNLGLTYWKLSAYPEALRQLTHASRLFAALGDRRGESKALMNIALIDDQTDAKPEALRNCDRALAIRKELDDPYLLANAYYNRGVFLEHAHRFTEAFADYQTSLRLSRQHGFRIEEIQALSGLACLHEQRGRGQEAVKLYLEALTRAQRENCSRLAMHALKGVVVCLVKYRYADDDEAVRQAFSALGTTPPEGKRAVGVLLDMVLNQAIAHDDLTSQIEVRELRTLDAEIRGDLRQALEEHRACFALYKRQHGREMALQVSNLRVSHEVSDLVLNARHAEEQKALAEAERTKQEELYRELKTTNEWQMQQFGRLAHDLKTPLATIATVASFERELLASTPTYAVPAEIITTIDETAHRALEEVDELLKGIRLRFRPQAAEPVRFVPAEAAAPVIAAHRPRADLKGIALDIDLGSEDPVTTDRNRFRDILENLLSNAIKFSPRGSSVQVRLHPWRDGCQLIVADRGPGFSADDRQQLFGMFARLSARPTGGESSSGLGLYIVKACVDMLGGVIELRPREPQGSAFEVYLPTMALPRNEEAPGNRRDDDRQAARAIHAAPQSADC